MAKKPGENFDRIVMGLVRSRGTVPYDGTKESVRPLAKAERMSPRKLRIGINQGLNSGTLVREGEHIRCCS